MTKRIKRVDTIPLIHAYVLHSLTHRLSNVEPWVKEHKTVIGQVTVWKLTEKDATDDRLCRLVEVLGHDDDLLALGHSKDHRPDLLQFPMTGDTPKQIQELVLNSPETVQDIVLAPKSEEKDVRIGGRGGL